MGLGRGGQVSKRKLAGPRQGPHPHGKPPVEDGDEGIDVARGGVAADAVPAKDEVSGKWRAGGERGKAKQDDGDEVEAQLQRGDLREDAQGRELGNGAGPRRATGTAVHGGCVVRGRSRGRVERLSKEVDAGERESESEPQRRTRLVRELGLETARLDANIYNSSGLFGAISASKLVGLEPRFYGVGFYPNLLGYQTFVDVSSGSKKVDDCGA